MPMLDPTSAEEAHIAQRLQTAPIAWLGSTRPEGRPHQVPVWFAWHDATALVFSPPTAQKVRNLRASPSCTLGPETEAGGNDVVFLEGRAEFGDPDDARQLAEEMGFIAKYVPLMGGPFEEWVTGFAQPVLVRIERIVAWNKPESGFWFRVIS